MNSSENGTSPLILTGDGSHTLFHTTLKEHYHSRQGSLQESEHIYLGLGLLPVLDSTHQDPVRIFEMGFGTGLNALLSWKLADRRRREVIYTGIEAYPVDPAQGALLNYGQLLQKEGLQILHESRWESQLTLSPYFSFRKIETFLQQYKADGEKYDVVYFDAFSPGTQPELWTVEIFSRIADMMSENACLVTYSSKGSVRRALVEAGFEVEKHPGPGRKREVIRAIRR